MAIARHALRSQSASTASDGSDEVSEALAAFGLQADPDQLERPQEPTAVCEVWPEHVDALHLFLACLGQLQLSLGGMGGASWRAVQAVNLAQEAWWLDLRGKRQAQVVRQYREIEAQALHILNEREVQAQKNSSSPKR